MKISWGIKIILSFVIFATGIIIMVAISMSRTTDLVSENYYEQEIKYQDQIDVLKRSAELDKSISLSFTGNAVILKTDYSKKLEGEIHFYRTSNAARDFVIPFNADSPGEQNIPASNLEKGLWRIKLNLNDGKEKFFVEKSIFID
jgi:hypothetical protein